MNNDLKFKSLGELYKRIFPALKSKAKELNKKGYHYIHEEDIWNYLKRYKWISSRDLDLSLMVNDIFNLNDLELDDYVKNEIKKYHRKVEQEDLI